MKLPNIRTRPIRITHGGDNSELVKIYLYLHMHGISTWITTELLLQLNNCINIPERGNFQKQDN